LKLLILTSVCLASGVKGEPIEVISLALPIRCELGVTCFVQNYVDHKDSDKTRDYRCGGRTYDGHDGTDIRIPNLEIENKGVDVLAAAPGRIVGVRDGVDDISVRIAGKAAVAGRQCGNGAVIEHEKGWQTQYCHMAKAAFALNWGQTVPANRLAWLDYPEIRSFPSSFHGETPCKIADPFAYDALPNTCGDGHRSGSINT
jgi:hypothetical protein